MRVLAALLVCVLGGGELPLPQAAQPASHTMAWADSVVLERARPCGGHLCLQLRGGAGSGKGKRERARTNGTRVPPASAAEADGVVEIPDALRGVPNDEWPQKLDELRASKEVSGLTLFVWCPLLLLPGHVLRAAGRVISAAGDVRHLRLEVR